MKTFQEFADEAFGGFASSGHRRQFGLGCCGDMTFISERRGVCSNSRCAPPDWWKLAAMLEDKFTVKVAKSLQAAALS
jgi:hypothetical protein